VLLAGAVAAGWGDGTKAPTVVSAERNGLVLGATVSRDDGSIVVETLVRNDRRTPVFLEVDECGRVTETVLARTRLAPRGRTWPGSVQAAKEQILRTQALAQSGDAFAPRIPGDSSSAVPPCVRPDRPRKLAPGEEVAERWALPLSDAHGLDVVGSAGTAVRVEAVETRVPDRLELLVDLPPGVGEALRAGRNVHVAVPASRLIHRAPSAAATRGPSDGQIYDRMLESRVLRRWIAAQPAGGWRRAQLAADPRADDRIELRLLTRRYERAAIATARADGTHVAVELPGRADRARVFRHGPATLPAGIAVLGAREDYVVDRDILPGRVALPSGRVVVGEYLLADRRTLDLRVRPGSYAVRATLARSRRYGFRSVALATLVLSRRPTVRWSPAGSITVDGASATFSSPEGVAYLDRIVERSPDEWQEVQERIVDSMLVHDRVATNFALGPDANLVELDSGGSDGLYPVFIGYDAHGRPTQVVLDFFLLHLAWPH
jgi:hypothetical protein